MMRRWWSRIRAVLNRRAGEIDFDEELAAHVEMLVEQYRSEGMTEPEARRAARLALGGEAQTREVRREAAGWPLIESIAQDLRYAARTLRRDLLFTSMVTLTLTLGVGMNSGVFSFVSSEVMRAPVQRDPATFFRARLEDITPPSEGRSPFPPGRRRFRLATNEEYLAIRDQARNFESVTAFFEIRPVLGAGSTTEIRAQLTTCNYFHVYRLRTPLRGSLFSADDCARSGSAPIVVIAEQLWKDRFASDPSVVGSVIRLNDVPLTVIGITPMDFDGRDNRVAAWIPYTMQSQLIEGGDLSRQGRFWLETTGRLRPGVTHSQAEAEVRTIVRQIDQMHAPRVSRVEVNNGARMYAPFFREGNRGLIVISLVLGLVTLIMLIACTNVTVLLLSRAAARSREMAVRLSLGAGRLRLFRQLLTESLLLAVIPFVASLFVVRWLPRAMYRWMALDQPRNLDPDWTVFAYSMGAAVLAGLFAGFAPALETLRLDLSGVLKGTTMTGSGKSRLRPLLVSAQLAMSMVLLAGAGLMMHTLYRLQTSSSLAGARSVMAIPLPLQSLKHSADTAASLRGRIEEQAARLPGVSAVSFSSNLPLGSASRSTSVTLPEETPARGTPRIAYLNEVSPRYFDTVRVRLLRGRVFAAAETQRRTEVTPAVIGRTLALTLWGLQDPIGKRFILGGRLCETAGIVEDTLEMQWNQGMASAGGAYLPYHSQEGINAYLMVRFEGDAKALAVSLRSLIGQAEPRLQPRPMTIAEHSQEHVDRFTVFVTCMAVLGALGLVLACIGVYGVVAFSVVRRTKEIGIRIAIGARRADVFTLVVRSGLGPVLGGLAAGLAITMAVAKVLPYIRLPLMGLSPHDPLTLGAALVAVIAPARRASRLNPVSSLREE
jgi:predicted permease